MKIQHVLRLGVACVALLASGGCLSAIKSPPAGDPVADAADRRVLAEETINQWSNLSAMAARLTIEQYGIPDEVHGDRLIWHDNGPWRRTVVQNLRPAFIEGDTVGVVEQTIDYALSPSQAADVLAFDNHLIYSPQSRELTAVSDNESANFLRMNLANLVIVGQLQPAQARDTYAQISSFAESGKTSPYLLGLHFQPPQ